MAERVISLFGEGVGQTAGGWLLGLNQLNP
jgi:hypothetical protein